MPCHLIRLLWAVLVLGTHSLEEETVASTSMRKQFWIAPFISLGKLWFWRVILGKLAHHGLKPIVHQHIIFHELSPDARSSIVGKGTVHENGAKNDIAGIHISSMSHLENSYGESGLRWG